MVTYFLNKNRAAWWCNLRGDLLSHTGLRFWQTDMKLTTAINPYLKSYGARHVRTIFHANGRALFLEKLEFDSEEQMTLFLLKFAH
jgi:hypothetical protein